MNKEEKLHINTFCVGENMYNAINEALHEYILKEIDTKDNPYKYYTDEQLLAEKDRSYQNQIITTPQWMKSRARNWKV